AERASSGTSHRPSWRRRSMAAGWKSPQILVDCPSNILIAVPTPLSKHRDPDLSFVVNSTRQVAERLRKGQLIVLESTTYPGTTRNVMKPILEKTGLKSGEDFYLAFSPEREDPGNEKFSTKDIPKI